VGYELIIAVCGAAVWWWFLARGRHALPNVPLIRPTWGGGEMILLTLFFFSAMSGAQLLVTRLAGTPVEPPHKVAFDRQVLGAALANLATVLLALLVAARGGRTGLAALGLRRVPRIELAEQVLFGLLGFFAVMPAIAGLSLVLELLARHFHLTFPPQEIVEVLRGPARPAGYPLIVAYALLGAPVFEETLFRGLAQAYFRRRLPPVAAILLAALAFAALHSPLHAALAVFALGLVLGYLRERTQSLLPPILAHLLFNLHTFATTQVLQ
jgi:membrane protease YdiL (CAAX protease family)